MVSILDIARDFFILCLVFVPLEHFFALRKDQKRLRQGWFTDILHVFFTGLFVQFGVAILLVISAYYGQRLIPHTVRIAIGAQPVWLAFVEILIIADLGFYWVHRAFHTIPFLWRFHSIHHSIEEMDFLAGHRVHPLDQILTRGATLLPGIVLGFPLEGLLVFGFIYHWHSVLLHSNFRLDIGPLAWLIAAPRFHQWHHANCPEAINRNYAGQLSILDLVFGTLYLPRRGNPLQFGIDESIPNSYADHLLRPFRKVGPPNN